MARKVLAKVTEQEAAIVESYFFKRMATLDALNYMGSNKGYGDNFDLIQDLKAQNEDAYAAFSVAFSEVANNYAPEIPIDMLNLDFNSCELYIIDN